MADVDEVDDEYGAFRHPRAGDIAELAYAQHGVVAMWQLRERGFGTRWVQRRVEGKTLHPRYRGVYAVGHQKLTLRGKWMAAVLASGPNALLSHRAAVALWELRPAPSGAIDVTVCARGRRGHKGIRIHNTRTLADDDRATLDGIPVTSAYRTLLDYAEVARYQQLRLALEAAVRRDLLDARKLDELIERSHGRHGLKPLTTAVAELKGPAPWTQSELENRFLAFLRAAGLPEPETNVYVAGVLVDCFWREQRLVVECDGWGFHKTRQQFEQDRRNDTRLQLAAVRPLRVTQPRLEYEAPQLEAEIRALLSAPPLRPGAGASGP